MKSVYNNYLIVYHANCKDGIASAFIAKKALKNNLEVNKSISTIPAQYNQDYMKDILEKLVEEVSLQNGIEFYTSNIIYFVDFCPSKSELEELLKLNSVKLIKILDHHKTAVANFEDLLYTNKKLEVDFNLELSGALITYYHFETMYGKARIERILPHMLFAYISDRDLWKFEMEDCAEVHEGISTVLEMNDVNSVEKLIEYDFTGARFNFEKYAEIGKTIIPYRDKIVKSKIESKKVKKIKFYGHDAVIRNSVDFVSEIGNAICKEYNCISMTYFIDPELKVVFSLRSLDHLPDVGLIAKSMGGGGHRNASGFSMKISDLQILMENGYADFTVVENHDIS